MDTGAEATAVTCRLASQGRVRVVDDDLGLSRVPCYALAHDSYGRLWVGTEDGPVTFDGLVWTPQAAIAGASGWVVRAFAACDDGALWMAGDGRGAVLVDVRAAPCRVVARLTAADGLPGNNVRALHCAPDGALLVATDAGVARVRAQRVDACVTVATGLPHADVQAVAQDGHGVVWAGTAAGLVALRGDDLSAVYRCAGAAGSTAVRGLMAHEGGVLACLADDTIVYAGWRDDGPLVRTVAHPGAGLRALTRDRCGHVWVGGGSGVAVLSEDGPVDHFSGRDGLPGPGVWAVHCTDEGRVWAGTSAGLALLDGPAHPVCVVPPEGAGHEPPTYAIAHDARGRTWLAREDGLVAVDGAEQVALPCLPATLAGETAWALAVDPNGHLWVGTRRDGLLQLDVETGRVLADHAAGRDVPSLAIAAERYLWACVTGCGLLVIDLAGLQEPRWVTAADGLPDDRVLCVGVVGDCVAAGGWKGWVAVLDAAGATLRVATHLSDGAAGRPVTDVCAPPERTDSLWISSYGGGLLDLDPRTLTVRRRFTAGDALPSDLVYACRVDGRGHVWAGTRRGLVRLTPDSGQTVVIGRSLGLPSDECNGQAVTVDERGRVWAGTVRGAAMVDAPAIPDVIPPPAVYLSPLCVMGQERPISAPVVIDDTDYDVVFAYGAVAYTAPAQVHYRVYLQGLDHAWSRPSTQRSTRYTNLACGTYTFLVQARNWGGVWSESVALQVVVERSAQGRELDAARAQAQAAEAARVQAEAAMQARNEILASVAHDLRAPLTAIKGRASMLSLTLERSATPDPARLHNHIAALNAAATRMAGMIEEIADAVRLELGRPLALNMAPVDLASLVRTAAASVGAGIGAGGATIEVDLEASLIVRGDTGRLTRMLENIISNAVKFSPAAGRVSVEAHVEGDEAVIVVQDHGVGIPSADVPHIFTPYFRASTACGLPGTGLGLAGARAIVAQHGGDIHLQSEEGQGTTVRLSLPLWHGDGDCDAAKAGDGQPAPERPLLAQNP